MNTSSPLSEVQMLEHLALPVKFPCRAVLDTDTFNEIDDQWALMWAYLAKERLDMRAVFAAPFKNQRSNSAGEGMIKSYEEILRIFELMGKDPEGVVWKGSNKFMTPEHAPVDSPAARRLIELAYEADRDGELLNVIAIGAPTNVASAILLDPKIVSFIRVIWLGGHNFPVIANDEFNLRQDIYASQTLFDSGVPLVLIPCAGVAELLSTNLPDIVTRCKPCGELGAFLTRRCAEFLDYDIARQKVIWDIATIAFFAAPDSCKSELIPAPHLLDDMSWKPGEPERHKLRIMTYLERHGIFYHFFEALKTGPVMEKVKN